MENFDSVQVISSFFCGTFLADGIPRHRWDWWDQPLRYGKTFPSERKLMRKVMAVMGDGVRKIVRVNRFQYSDIDLSVAVVNMHVRHAVFYVAPMVILEIKWLRDILYTELTTVRFLLLRLLS